MGYVESLRVKGLRSRVKGLIKRGTINSTLRLTIDSHSTHDGEDISTFGQSAAKLDTTDASPDAMERRLRFDAGPAPSNT